jgi:hypothetical protein
MSVKQPGSVRAGKGIVAVRWGLLNAIWLVLALLQVSLGYGSQLTRTLPVHFLPQTPVLVTIDVTPDSEVRVYAVEDLPPEGWTIAAISEGGFRDPVSGKVKWGPFFDKNPRQLSYEARPSGQPGTRGNWAGSGAFDDLVLETEGAKVCLLRPSTVVRSLPEFYLSAQPMEIVLEVTPGPTVRVYAIEEELPAGWTVQAVAGGGALDPATRRLKWGPFFDSQPRRLTYTIRSPLGDLQSYLLEGRGLFDETEEQIGGQSLLVPEPSSVRRILPGLHIPGVGFWVTNVVSPARWVIGYAVEDRLPSGWAASQVSDGGVFDASLGRVKWGPFGDRLSRRLVYRVTPAGGAGRFEGVARFNNQDVSITGDEQSIPFPSRISRAMSDRFESGVAFSVTNRAEPAPGIHAYAVEEFVPTGWRVLSMTHGGGWDLVNGKIKWGPFNDGTVRDLVAVLLPPRGSAEVFRFSGGGRFDETSVEIEGVSESRLRVGEITRTVPPVVSSTPAFSVRLQVVPAAGIEVYAVEEVAPSGWTVSAVSDQGVFDRTTGRVKWGPFFDSTVRTFTYQLLPPPGSGDIVGRFEGRGLLDGIEAIVGGDETTRVSGQTAVVRLLIQNLNETQVQVEVVGVAGTTYAIEASSDLVVWTPWVSGVADAGGSLKRPDAVRPTARFYRIR